MRIAIAVITACLLAAPAAAQHAPPSATLDRAVKLYTQEAFWEASIELGKIVRGETTDSPENKLRAEFFLAKTMYQLGFHAVAWSRFAAIAGSGGDHPYHGISAKWLVAVHGAVPSPLVRSPLYAYRSGLAVDDPVLATVRDELALQLGRELASRDVPRAEAVAMLARVSPRSEQAARAQLEIARIQLRANDLTAGIAAALAAARDPALVPEAARLIASWTHVHGAVERGRAPLAELARSSAYARYQLSRAHLDARAELPGLGGVSVEVFDAVMLPAACRGRWPADLKPLARTVIDEARPVVTRLLAVEDNAELYHHLAKLRAAPSRPGTDVVVAMLGDPAMRERFGFVAELEREIELAERSDRAWQTTMVAAEVLQELVVILAIEQAETATHARQRLELLDRHLTELARVLADAAPAFAVPAGPDVEIGRGLAITGALCGDGGTGTLVAAGPPVAKPTSGCAGCGVQDPHGGSFALVGLLATIGLRARRRRRPRTR